MIRLTERLDHYLAVRRGFGYDLSTAERVLRRFTAFADQEQTEYVTTKLFLKWKSQHGIVSNSTWATKLSMVRVFATWLNGIDPRNEIPPSGLIAGQPRRSRPFIYTPTQIRDIVVTAARLTSDYGLRGATCSTLFGLIATTGLRISEAVGLDDESVDLDKGVLTVQRSKNGKSRFLPIAPSVVEHLSEYRHNRNRLSDRSEKSFFRFDQGQRPTDCSVRYNFAKVSQQIGLRTPGRFHKHGKGPRIHDLRHTFAVRTLIGWYRQGLDPDREMIRLSTYLGHSSPENTYWYIEAVPELLKLASDRACRSLAKEEGR